MATVIEQVRVPFRGDGAGVGPLSWGQRELWGGMVKQCTWFPIGAVRELPPGTTVEDLAAQLRLVATRHHTVRTRLRFAPEGVQQEVSAEGELTLEVVDTGPAEDPAEVADQVAHRYRETDYDFAGQWPVRVAAIRHQGALTHQVMIMCHLVTDASGAAILTQDLISPPPAAPRRTQPLAQAAWQSSPAGQRLNRQSLRHWEKLLRAIPPRRFPAQGPPARPRYWQAHLDSPAAYLAAHLVADRSRLDPSQVLLGFYLVALARVTGVDPVVSRVIVNNRFRPGLAEVVAPVSQTGLLAVEVAGVPVAQALTRVQRQVMAAYKHAYYDPSELQELAEAVGRDRGEEIDIFSFFNDRRIRYRDAAPAVVPELADVLAAVPRGRFWWGGKLDRPTERFFVHIEDLPATLGVSMWADTAYVSPPDIEAFLRGLETVAVEAATAVG